MLSTSKKIKLAGHELVNKILIPTSYDLGKPITMPTLAGLFLTNLCNSKCTMCSFWKLKEDKIVKMTYSQAKKILLQLKKSKIQFLSFSAEGEIFMNPDSIRILSYAKQLGFPFSINSNCLAITPKIAKQIAEIQPYSLVIGLDTINPEIYEKIRGIKNGPKKIITAIDLLHSNNFYNISIGTVIMNYNLDDLVDLTLFAIKHKIKNIRFTAFQQLGFGKEYDTKIANKYSSPSFLKNLNNTINKLIFLKKKYNIISNSVTYLKMIPEYFKSSRHYTPINCMQGYYSFNIYPNGDLILCQVMGQHSKIGNIYQKSLKEIWFSERAKKIRAIIKNKKCPGCWLSCYAENNLLFSIKYGLEPNINRFLRSLSL